MKERGRGRGEEGENQKRLNRTYLDGVLPQVDDQGVQVRRGTIKAVVQPWIPGQLADGSFAHFYALRNGVERAGCRLEIFRRILKVFGYGAHNRQAGIQLGPLGEADRVESGRETG